MDGAKETESHETRDRRYAAIYARVSTEDQGKGFSIPTQIEACQKLADREGYMVPDTNVLLDEGISGTTMDRPSLRKLRDLVNARAIAAVVVHDPDRLSRNLGHQLLLAEEFERAEVKLLIVSHPMEQGPEGWLFFQMRGALAEYERAKLLERTFRGKLGKARAGHPLLGGSTPLGYRYLPETPEQRGRLEIVEDEAALVRRIFHLCIRGNSAWKIAQQLTAEGQLTKTDRRVQEWQAQRVRRGLPLQAPPAWNRKKHPVGTWSLSTIQRLLRNRCYAGKLFFNKRSSLEPDPQQRRVPRNPKRPKSTTQPRGQEEWVSIPVPAIVTVAEWEAAQAALAEHQRHNPRRRRNEYLFLAGRLRCACGRALSGTMSHGVRVYRCTAHATIGRAPCRGRVRAEPLEARVWEIVEELLREPEAFRLELDRRQAGISQRYERSADELATADRELAACDRQLARWHDAYAHEVIDLTEFQRLKAELDQRRTSLAQLRAEITAGLEQTAQQQQDIDVAIAFIAKVKADIPQYGIRERRKVLEVLQLYAVYHTAKDKLRLFFNIPVDDPETGETRPMDEFVWKGAATIPLIQWDAPPGVSKTTITGYGRWPGRRPGSARSHSSRPALPGLIPHRRSGSCWRSPTSSRSRSACLRPG